MLDTGLGVGMQKENKAKEQRASLLASVTQSFKVTLFI